MKTYSVSFLASILVLTSCSAGFDFIWPSDIRSEKNHTLGFQLEKAFPSEEATLEICAANAYMVFLDDEMVAFGPARTAHGHIRKDEIRLEGLSPEKKLTVTVAGYNINSFCYPDEKPYFAARVLDSGRRAFASSRDFSCSLLDDRMQKVERFSYQRDFSEAYRMEKDRSLYYKGDGSIFERLEVSGIKEKPVILAREVSYPKYERIPLSFIENGTFTVDETRPIWKNRYLDRISDTTSKGFRREELEVCTSAELSGMVYSKGGDGVGTVRSGEYSVADASRTITGFYDLRLRVEEPALFYVLFDEIDLNESGKYGEGINLDFKRNGCTSAVRYELAPGEYHLVNFEQFSARFLKFVCSRGSLRIEDCKLISFENPDMFKLRFESADDSLNLIVRASQNTLAQNGVDLFTDCPQRERAGWLCDAFFSARAEFLLSGTSTVNRCFLENYALAPQLPQLPDGMIPMCYPGDHLCGEFIPNWSMWYVLQLYDHYRRTGDKAMVEMSKDKIRALLKYFSRFENESGLLENLENWVFVEWSKANSFVSGVNYPSNMLYSEMLVEAGEMLGDSGLEEKGMKMKETIAEQSFNGEFFEDNAVRENGVLARTGNTTETCQYYAFFFGIATPESHPALHDKLFTVFGPSRDSKAVYPKVYPSNAFIGNYLRMEILRREGRTAQILKESKQFFHYMAERTRTLWEHQQPEKSLNHGFASYASNLIVEAVTGLSDYDAATNSFKVSEPQVKMDCHAEIPFGNDWIIVDFRGDDRTIFFPESVANGAGGRKRYGDPELAMAEVAASVEPVSVMQKPKSFTGDPHNYESLSSYAWPDAADPDAPWKDRDGELNPEVNRYDRTRINDMASRLTLLCNAWLKSGEKRFRDAYFRQLDAWFIDKATRMNPDMEYSQIRVGADGNHGQPHGIIDAYVLTDVLRTVRIMERRGVLSRSRKKALVTWFVAFNDWLMTSSLAQRERAQKNNHSIACDVLIYDIALFTGNAGYADAIQNSFASSRLAVQIRPDGTMPAELKRTRAYHYSIFNLKHILDFCYLSGEERGFDFYLRNKALIDASASYLAQFIGHREKFPYMQIEGLSSWEDEEIFLKGELERLDLLRCGAFGMALKRELYKVDHDDTYSDSFREERRNEIRARYGRFNPSRY